MDPITPSTTPLDPETIRRAMRLSVLPGQEKIERERMAMMQALFNKPHTRVSSGALPAALWGAGDAIGDIAGAYQQRKSLDRLADLQKEGLQSRQALYDAVNAPAPKPEVAPQDDPSVPPMLARPDTPEDASARDQRNQQAQDASGLRRRNLASTLAMTGDPAMEEAGKRMLQEQQLDREYAMMRQQFTHQQQQLALETRKQTATETEQAFGRGHTLRTEQEWETKPVPDMPGAFTHTSKHTGESWFIMPGEAPVQISKGQAPGQAPGAGGPVAAAAANGGKLPPYVKQNTEQMRTSVATAAGASGLLDALKEGFPSDNRLRSIGQSLQWKAAEHGMPQLASDANQGRVSAWDAVFDPVARERAGLRIPEDQMQRMRMELRPQPGDSWDNQVSKTKRIINTFRSAAANLLPQKSRPILAELDQIESSLPRNRAEYKAFNKNAELQMANVRKGGSGLSAVVPPQAGPPQAAPPVAGPPQAPPPAGRIAPKQPLSAYGWPVTQ